ncbi:MAG: SpoIIE family protein phosphatase, partial [Bacteroidetes bacterium]|nr:SpoIIE family protein phosphatase [Bacteroidota bacterium]
NADMEKKNQQITKSLTYAKLIQSAILPSDRYIRELIPDSFVFFRPRDIVSGDFYWFAEYDNKIFLAVADCTGHGVPGALMSMIGYTMLNDIVNDEKVTSPSAVLGELNKDLVNLLHKGDFDEPVQSDGMEIAFCAVDKKAGTFSVASANQPVYFFAENELKIIDGNIRSIGGMFSKMDNVRFDEHKFSYEPGTPIYMSTDGFCDQFGGPERKKFMTSRFRRMLSEIHLRKMEDQLGHLTAVFDDWKGNESQIDDVLVVGIRL